MRTVDAEYLKMQNVNIKDYLNRLSKKYVFHGSPADAKAFIPKPDHDQRQSEEEQKIKGVFFTTEPDIAYLAAVTSNYRAVRLERYADRHWSWNEKPWRRTFKVSHGIIETMKDGYIYLFPKKKMQQTEHKVRGLGREIKFLESIRPEMRIRVKPSTVDLKIIEFKPKQAERERRIYNLIRKFVPKRNRL